MMKLSQLMIKDRNTREILRVLQSKRELTRQDIARIVGISIPTVTNNINHLISEGVVAESKTMASTGGRKPHVLEFLPNSYHAIGIQVSSDHSGYFSKVKIILVNLDLRKVHEESFDYSTFDTFDQIIDFLNIKIE